MSKQFYDLNKYKTEISLPDFLREVYGWTKAEGSTNSQPKLKSPSGDMQLVIKMNQKGHYTCWNTYENDPFYNTKEEDDKRLKAGSTIIDVVQWEHQNRTGKLLSITEVAAFLEGFLKNEKLLAANSSFQLEKELITNEIAFTKLRTEALPLTDTAYLESRGINPQVLKTKTWEGVFCNVKFYSAAAKTTYINTATRLVNKSGIVGMSIRTANGQKRIEGHRLDSLSSSRFDKSKPVERLHVFESMIDAVSYFQMKYPIDTDKNIQMVSTEGAITSPQINTIQEIINRNQVKLIELNIDNDIHGLIYAANLAGNIQLVEQKNKELEYFRVSRSGKNEDRIICIDVKVNASNSGESKLILDKYFPKEIFDKYIDSEKWNIISLDDSPNNY
ncbi:MAG: toprim domain-containing protein [Dysgonomonas sp.]